MKHLFITYLTVFLLCASIPFITACFQTNKTLENKGPYELAQPEKITMPESLLEISGIALQPGSDDTVYAVQDEAGKIYRMALQNKNISHYRFAKDGDFEDVAIFKQQVFLLQSDGTLYSAAFFPTSPNNDIESVRYKDLLPKGEYEGLFINEADSMVYVLCKNCSGVDNKKLGIVYTLKMQGNSALAQMATLIYEVKQKDDHGWHPAALAKHPLTGDWYVLSSANHLLCVYSSDWELKTSYDLPSAVFNQPEGICFHTNGDMYIANEGSDSKKGNILIFRYNKQ